LTTGHKTLPRSGPDFPAQEICSAYEWDDLVLPDEVLEEMDDLVAWVENERILMEEWGLRKHLKPGYRALFYGPPGSGKTVTAALLGKRLSRPVFRIDLSQVVSKYIGETEKNLARVFDHAAEGDMILFFDEADALFGKRGDTRTANDRHANQQISYLLQRIEDCPGLVILATNLRGNIDKAFARRFQAIVHFPIPDADARLRLWQNALTGSLGDRAEFALKGIASNYEIAAGSIVNALRHGCIRALKNNRALDERDVRDAIIRELAKDGRTGCS
jgi:SpoVK/Ycf46/Vps4 family AAA+-type ATPase